MNGMRNRKQIWLLVITAVLAIGFYFAIGDGFNLCGETGDYRACIRKVNDIFEPLLWSFLPLLAVSFTLLFFKREIFIAWAKFGAPAFVVMLAVIYYTYNNAPASGGWVNWGSDEQVASVLLPILYVAISLGIVIYRRLAKNSGKPV